jgi:hypothetical protein
MNAASIVTITATGPNTRALAASTALGDSGEGGSDATGRVFGAHDEDSEDADRELGKEQPAQALCGGVEGEALPKPKLVESTGVSEAEHDPESHCDADGRDERPDGGAHRAELRPF